MGRSSLRLCIPEAERKARWVRTGDEVVIDKNHDVFVVDRLKEIMKVRGFQVAPAELEGHLLDHPYVSDVCVVGVPDEFSGEVPMAFVVPSSKAGELMKTGPQGMLEVKKAICKVGSGSRGVSLDVDRLHASTFRTPRLHTSISQGESSLWTAFRRTQVGNFCGGLCGTRLRN